MKIRCNVCRSKEIVELPNPETKEEGFTVYCGDYDYYLWRLMDNGEWAYMHRVY